MSGRGFLVPVELRFIDDKIGHGVFSLGPILRGTEIWKPNLVVKVSLEDLKTILKDMTCEKANEYLRQGFVLSSDLDHLCVNVDDLGRFTNHSSDPNMGYADFTESQTEASVALRDIAAGEELTCNYSGLGSPQWYKDLCVLYNVTPTDEVAMMS